MTAPRASDNAPSLLVVASEYLRAQAPSTPRIVYSVPIGVAGAKAIAHHSASPRMPGVPSAWNPIAPASQLACYECRSEAGPMERALTPPLRLYERGRGVK